MTPEAPPPFPGPLAALWLTVGSWLVTGMFLGSLIEPLGPITALGLGLVCGLGLTGTLATRWVPPPQAERLGLRGFGPRVALSILLLLPLVLLVSELDNVLRALVPAAEVVKPDVLEDAKKELEAGFLALEATIVFVGLAPVVEEFFFRGVVQQGLVALGGAVRGILATALLFALGHGNLFGSQGWLSALAASLVTGVALGVLRQASGSLLASIALSMAMAAVGVAAMQLEPRIPIPGFNAPGAHTPVVWLLPALLSVGLGFALLRGERLSEPPARMDPAELSPPRE